MHVLVFGTYDETTHPRVAVLAEGLAAHGHTVSACNAPLNLTTAARLEILRQPWRLPGFALRLVVRWVQLIRRARKVIRRDGRPDAVLVGYLGQFDVHLARMLFPRTPILLDYMVSLAGTAKDRGTAGVRARMLHAVDRAALRRAAVPIVDTDEDLSLLPPKARSRAVVVPVGAPGWWFTGRPHPRPTARPLHVVFFGLYTPLQGAITIGEALALLAHDESVEATMVGNGQDHDAVRDIAQINPRVRWIDWLEPRELARLVGEHDVCLGIFGTSDKARCVVPNKVYQGAAAGCAVVTSDTPPQRRALGAAGIFVPPGSASELARMLQTLAVDRNWLHERRCAAYERAWTTFLPSIVTSPLARRVGATKRVMRIA